MSLNPALLLIGPTGSGKTPLGELLEAEGWGGRRCRHFDFGEELRRVAALSAPGRTFDEADIAFVRSVLDEGALLENEHFHIAENTLFSFLEREQTAPEDMVILNGLPRHVGQAEQMDRLLDVREVLALSCTPEVVCERIDTNAGGDRSGRIDDCVADIRKKLIIFRERTVPLLDHYRAKGARVREFEVKASTTPGEVLQALGGSQ